MKIQAQIILLFFSMLLFSSCGVKNYVAPPFTEMSKILRLQVGQSVEDVSSVLKIPPYDIVHSYETGSMILIYNYRLKNRRIVLPSRAAKQEIHNSDAQVRGEQWYSSDYRELYLLFANDTLKSIFGEEAFAEGVSLEMIDRSLMASELNGDTTAILSASEFSFLSRTHQKEGSILGGALGLKDDESINKRRMLLKKILIGFAGITGIRLVSDIIKNIATN